MKQKVNFSQIRINKIDLITVNLNLNYSRWQRPHKTE
jgi:hypothetical protein